MGRQIGEGAREEIRQFCAIALERVNLTTKVSQASALAVAEGCVPYAEDYAPDLVEEMRGMAEGAGVSFAEIMLLQVRNQLRPDPEAGCTSLSLEAAPALRRGRLLAQNWDADVALDPVTIVLTRRPEGKPANLTLTQAGLIAYIGLNDAGIGVCLNTLPAPSRPLGVPHYLTVRAIYESRSLATAVEAVRRANRAIPANIMLTTPDGPADLEVTLEDVRVLRSATTRGISHTNHCQHPELREINDRFPELIQSHSRLKRVEDLLDRCGDTGPTVAQIQEALRDHDGFPRSICRHANDDPGTGFWSTVFSVVIEPEALRMQVARGTPCQAPYETYTFLP